MRSRAFAGGAIRIDSLAFISNLARAGVMPKVAQTLARHSTITLTMDRYTHVGLHDISSGIASLAALPGRTPDAAKHAVKATGTDGKRADAAEFGCSVVAQSPALSLHRESSEGIEGPDVRQGKASPQTLAASAPGTSCHRETSSEVKEAPPGFEPGMADLQSTALPLG